MQLHGSHHAPCKPGRNTATPYWNLSLRFVAETGARWVSLAWVCLHGTSVAPAAEVLLPPYDPRSRDCQPCDELICQWQPNCAATVGSGKYSYHWCIASAAWKLMDRELLLLVRWVLQKIPQGPCLLNNFLLSLYISSIVKSPSTSSHVFLLFLFYPSASSFLPATGIVFIGRFIPLELFCMKLYWKRN